MNVKHELNAGAHDPAQIGLGHVPSRDAMNSESQEQGPSRIHTVMATAERFAGPIFLLPAVLALLFLSLFPLLASLYVSLARFKIAKGGFTLTFVGLDNYKKLFFGTEQTHFLGAFAPLTPAMLFVFGIVVVGLAMFLARYLLNARVSVGGLIGRLLLVLGLGALAWIFTRTLWSGGRLGTLTITIVYVFVGIFF
ncbi:MAG TPA: hypothetical protein VGK56_04410, partial [Anaerolineales bacterium]